MRGRALVFAGSEQGALGGLVHLGRGAFEGVVAQGGQAEIEFTAGFGDWADVPPDLAQAVMLLAANPLGRFIDANPTVKMLALAFILLIGAVLILDGLDVHVPKPYIYAAMGFSVLVEWLNLLMRRRAVAHHVPGAGNW